MKNPLSKAVRRIKPSPTLAVTQKARELKAQGRDIIGLGAGEPDFDTPDHIKQAAQRAIRDGHTKYTPVDGIPELKRAICDKFKRENNIETNPDQVMVSAGGKQVIYNAIIASVDPGDEVLIPTPYWVSYPDIAALAGGKPVFAETSAKNGFKLKPEDLESAISKKTKWVILNSPNNPSGAGLDPGELEAIAETLRKHPGILIMSDDIYEHITYDNFRFTTLAQIAPDLAPRTLTINGASKAFAMTGWRIGYCTGPANLIAAMRKIQGQSTTNPASISQYAALAALTGPTGFLTQRAEAFRKRRDLTLDLLNKTPGLSCPKPQGAFYLYPSCAGTIGKKTRKGAILSSDEDFAAALLEEEGVAVVPGAAFGLSPFFRLSYATSDEALAEAGQRIRRFCQNLL